MIHFSSYSKASLNHKLESQPSSISGISIKSPFDKVISYIQNLLLVFDSSETSLLNCLLRLENRVEERDRYELNPYFIYIFISSSFAFPFCDGL